MKSGNRIAYVLLFSFGLVLALIAANKNQPYLMMLRGVGNTTIILASIVVLAGLLWRSWWRQGHLGKLAIVVWCLPPLLLLCGHLSFEQTKRVVLRADPVQVRKLGPHFMVGYTSFSEVALLAQTGLIGGIYITGHNIRGRSAEALRDEISALQDIRRAASLPPLFVAADQEGGIVGHLSPPLTRLPALATLAELPPDDREEKAQAFGRIHGRELAALGVNLNLAPVLDLRPEGRTRLDFNTLIGQRAISADPRVVSELAQAYVSGLQGSGVSATVKHFPGLGRVRADTHHFSAELDTPQAQLEAADWRPFREVLASSNAQLMIGHVTLSAIDPARPASHSKRVVDGIIRNEWNYQGIVMTDDLVMGAIYQHDVCTAVTEALNAGVDLLLVAIDGSQFYRLFACALDASRHGRLDGAMLRQSEARLGRGAPRTPRPELAHLVRHTLGKSERIDADGPVAPVAGVVGTVELPGVEH
ncbi:MAG: glycoside hydrolase family 3 protein [Bradyrhizobium sp.]|uniref:glycoside hydrolase family 3 N-terminal domain-containing protein n=1 Tax=Bradyrhizobium sp. TaxID=376 RepID=UPI0025BEA1C5|nr:glycoside hydrolase family 3 N-terminal domain-containing protein [Bradyrhizobium sp.]MBI5264740.1 glycoside hydrolase family 3 protein [Bradyrhizobium sp.]